MSRTDEQKRELALEFVRFLNSLVAIDREAIAELSRTRCSCNRELADHPTVQVAGGGGEPFTIGLLGLLNGFIGVRNRDGRGYLAARFNDQYKLVDFILTPEVEST